MMKKLIIVEDEHLIRLWLSRAIDYQHLGFELVYLAEDGEDGARAIRKVEPDVVLTDICMPRMDAFAMFEATKDCSYEKIILSGFSDFEHAKKAMHYGVREFISKPIQMEEVVASLLDLVAQFKGEEESTENGRIGDDLLSEILPTVESLNQEREISRLVLDWIQSNYGRRASIAHMAEELGYSESYIYKCFKEDLKLTVNDYLNRYRICKAIDLLWKNPDLLVYELAEAVGFSDENYFNKVFKRYTHVSVSSFKKNTTC
ncbi:helix-turn-helix domain-containing protein [Atopobacter sp. AH10]|uniref:helix-turn-helix domain-containing protein n=1 Tax=Atopobacter sp. AH10 TaxID=2315861 RepID=UPI001F23EACE|nr:helix-turn-helix domain-containing protein [Atopobacter sp. AH10]